MTKNNGENIKKSKKIACCIAVIFFIGSIFIIYLMVINFPNVEKYKYLKENGWEINGIIIDYKEQRVPYTGGDRPGFSCVYLYSIQYFDLQNELKIFYYDKQTTDYKDEYGKEMLGKNIPLYIDDRGNVALAEGIETKYLDAFWFCVIGTIVALGFMIAVTFAVRSIMRQK